MGLRLAGAYPTCCSCEHEECKRHWPQRWCCHWFWVQWVFDHYVAVCAIDKKLRRCLGQRPFRYWGAKYQYHRDDDDKYYYRLLVCVDLGGDGLGSEDRNCLDVTDEECLAAQDSEVDTENSFMIPFICCASFLKRSVPGWVLTVVKQGNTMIGDATLKDTLADSIADCGLKLSGSDEKGRNVCI